MIKVTLATLTLAATLAAPAADVQIYTAYTPTGAPVIMTSTDPSTHDDDRVLTMDESAELYIWEQGHDAYTLYTIEGAGITELWMYGYGTPTAADDIAADWQTWPFPSVRLLEGYGD